MATLSRIRVHPIKALDGVDRERVAISEVGGLAGDRAYAIVDADGEYVNGKRTAAVHRLRSSVDLDAGVATIGVAGPDERRRFDLDDDRDALARWLGEYFGFEVDVEAAPGGDLADSRVYSDIVAGATVASAATIREVASWFPALDEEDVRRRFRANLEVEGVEPFWEDRLVRGGPANGDGDHAGESEPDPPRFRVGAVTFRGVKPITRCVVPTRDPYTGEATDGFRQRFLERREETFPARADRDAFDHFYALTTLAHPDEGDWDEAIAVGDQVELLD